MTVRGMSISFFNFYSGMIVKDKYHHQNLEEEMNKHFFSKRKQMAKILKKNKYD